MRRTSTDNSTNPKKRRIIQLAASALAVSAAFASGAALADHKGPHPGHYKQGHYKHGHHSTYNYQDRYRYGPIYWNQQQRVRVHIPVRDHGPEVLPIGRLIAQNSHIDLDRYRLVAVVTENGRFSNGYASLRTGDSRTDRYFLNSHGRTWIPAPSRADSYWRLRLGPGTQVRSLTAVLEPRHRWGYRKPADRRYGSTYQRGQHVASSAPWLGLAWMFANADEDQHRDRKQAKRFNLLRAEQERTEAELAKTQQKLERSQERNKQLKSQRERLAEELSHERLEDRQGRRGKADKHRKGKRATERRSEREVKRTVRYVVSAS